jgi:maltose-binding protein MalE
LLASDVITNDEVLSGFAAQLEKAKPMPNISRMQSLGTNGSSISSNLEWSIYSEDAMNNAAKQVKDAIDSQNNKRVF